MRSAARDAIYTNVNPAYAAAIVAGAATVYLARRLLSRTIRSMPDSAASSSPTPAIPIPSVSPITLRTADIIPSARCRRK